MVLEAPHTHINIVLPILEKIRGLVVSSGVLLLLAFLVSSIVILAVRY